MTLPIDPVGEPAEALGRIDDWLLWAEPDGDDETELVCDDPDLTTAAGLATVAELDRCSDWST